MAVYTNPATPVALTAITTSFWNVNARDNIIYFRGLLPSPAAAGKLHLSSGADTADWLAAGAAGLPLVSNGTTPAYAALTNAGLAAGVAVANLGYTPLNKAGDTSGGTQTAPEYRLNSGGSIWQWIASGGSMFLAIPSLVSPIELTATAVKLTGAVTANGNTVIDTSNDGTLCNAADSAALGGVAASGYARIASGSYAGSNNGDRAITTGFICKAVDIYGYNASGTVMIFAKLKSTTTAQNMAHVVRSGSTPIASPLAMADATRLDASNGFHVSGSGTDGTDGVGFTYFWTAWG